MAKNQGLYLIEIAPNANPPVCKIMDMGKFKYDAQKKANIAKKKQKIVLLKEIKMRPVTETHDYDFKVKNAKKFIAKGDKVKFTVKFRGREMQHTDLGKDLMNKIIEETKSISSNIKNAYIDFSKMTISLVAVVSDVIKNGKPVIGYGFNSNGRYGQGHLIRERFRPRLLEAKTEKILNEDMTNFDPQKMWEIMMKNEKPGGHGERSVAVGTIDMAIWDLVSKIEEKLGSDYKRGWGLQLIKELMDTVEFESTEKGTTVTMTKKK